MFAPIFIKMQIKILKKASKRENNWIWILDKVALNVSRASLARINY